MIFRCLVEAHLWTNMEETKHIPQEIPPEFLPKSPGVWRSTSHETWRVSKGDAGCGFPTMAANTESMAVRQLPIKTGYCGG